MLEPIGFWSYSTADDKNSRGKLSQLRTRVKAEIELRLGRKRKVEIFQDVAALETGDEWAAKIEAALAKSSFLIPIVTPDFFQSEWCCREVALFRDRERELGRGDLIFPIHYIDVGHVDCSNPDDCHDPEVVEFLRTRQWAEFHPYRHRSFEAEEVGLFIEKLAKAIATALRAPGPAPSPPAPPARPVADPRASTPAETPRPASPPPPRPARAEPLPFAEHLAALAHRAGIRPARAEPLPFAEGGPPPAFARASGRDEVGPWLDFAVPDSQGGEVTQRMRWIPPGRFLMGSPASEPERYDNEGPQHRVTIGRGFWLFDTACTQALWQAVTGANPSRFKGTDRPVESVSWNDCGEFLRRIAPLVPGLDLCLPSEAQWEYACRAVTTTPFSFGTTITPDQVNYDGNHPYAGGKKGRCRAETVPVRSLPPNPFGLYEMHGNVWEWCADHWHGNYQGAPGDGSAWLGGATRMLRGGSWSNYARFVRSASRYAVDPGNAGSFFGFRCARVQE
jgi:formylglycine-generating enzyme required for sulfatase activity